MPENVEAYRELYAAFKEMHDFFGRGGTKVMRNLKAIKAQVHRSN